MKIDSGLKYFDRYQEFIPDFENFLLNLRQDFPTVLRQNKFKISREKYISLLQEYKELGFIGGYKEICNTIYAHEIVGAQSSLGKTIENALGYYYIQGASSFLPVLALNPGEGDFVLDLAAAPGGKTSLLSEQMNNLGTLIANDAKRDRVRILKATLERLGVINTIVTHNNGELFSGTEIFDKVLLDGPCSSEGTFRILQGQKEFKVEENFRQKLNTLQKRLIIRAFRLLKKSGTMIYSTCTYAPEENEEIVNFLLETEKSADILPLEITDFAIKKENGLDQFESVKYDQRLKMAWRLYPHQFNSWGFFLVKITRR